LAAIGDELAAVPLAPSFLVPAQLRRGLPAPSLRGEADEGGVYFGAVGDDDGVVADHGRELRDEGLLLSHEDVGQCGVATVVRSRGRAAGGDDLGVDE